MVLETFTLRETTSDREKVSAIAIGFVAKTDMTIEHNIETETSSTERLPKLDKKADRRHKIVSWSVSKDSAKV